MSWPTPGAAPRAHHQRIRRRRRRPRDDEGLRRRAARREEIIELANGCICCTVADDFMPRSRRCWPATEARSYHHRDLRTGSAAAADPGVQLAGDRSQADGGRRGDGGGCRRGGRGPLRRRSRARRRQRAADPSLDHDNPLEEVYKDQLLCADLVVLNKTDLVTPGGSPRSRPRSPAPCRAP